MSYFSIIMPAYNNAPKITAAIEAVKAQLFEDWELVIVDDGSTDNTKNVVTPFLKDERINYYWQENKGVTKARNEGISRAGGEFVGFLDSDDTVTKEWLLDFKELISGWSNPGYLSCALLRNGKLILPKTNPKIVPEKFSSLAGSFFLRSQVVKDIGGYDPILKQSENWELSARALEYCKENNLDILHHSSPNFMYENHPTVGETRLRDYYRAEATFYLYKKYQDSGVFNYRKDDFLLSSAVNFTRAGEISKARKMFYKYLQENPSAKNFIRVLTFEIPYLRNRKWKRNF